MNRRDLLKQAGATMLAASSVGVSSLVYAKPPEEDLQDLVVTFSGPFCYWVEPDYMRIMAPQVAGNFCVPHIPWVATTENEKRLQWCPTTTYHYELEGITSRTTNYTGTTMCSFEQDTCGTPPKTNICRECPPILVCAHGPATSNAKSSPHLQSTARAIGEEYHCCPALFDMQLPFPDLFVGINPTCVKFTPARKDGPHYASAVNFLYRNTKSAPINFENLRLVSKDPPGGFDFHPDFKNDHGFPSATMRINLSPIENHDDPDHRHAQQVFFQMVKMFPWVDVQCIEFCDPAVKSGNACSTIQVGPGNDCLEPVFLLKPQPPSKRKQ